MNLKKIGAAFPAGMIMLLSAVSASANVALPS